jgi:broad specificity phosphatase PhoE
MRLILLRHEERNINDVSFYSQLTYNGLYKLSNLTRNLEKYNIDIIYSSPFKRTIQTINIYCKNNNKKVNLEYGLYEYIHNSYFTNDNWYIDINKASYFYLNDIINFNYRSIINKNEFIIPENEISLSYRINKFMTSLLLNNNNYNIINNNKTILLVSHKGIINKIKDIYIKKTEMNDEFPMGYYEVYDIDLKNIKNLHKDYHQHNIHLINYLIIILILFVLLLWIVI